MEFRILGPVEVVTDEVSIPLGGPKPRTVLAALLLADGNVVRDSWLSHLLWRDEPPSTADAQIYTYVSRLRKVFTDKVFITRRGKGYALTIAGAPLDYHQFTELARTGRTALLAGQYHTASARLGAGLDLWNGPALADVTEYLLDEELAGLEEERLSALENRIEADIALNRHEELVPELMGAVRQHPLRERFRTQLMYSLQACSRRAEALTVYNEGRRLLADELGVDPDAAMQETYHDILRGDLLPHAAVRTAAGSVTT